ncbi:MAG: peptidase M41, partial [Chryseobacterium sp.]
MRSLEAGKIQKVLIDKQTEKADVFLTKEAKTKTVEKKDNNPFSSSIGMSAKPDYILKYGDLQIFLGKFETAKQQNPALTTTKDYAEGESPLMSILIQALIWITILGLFYFILF